jgi:hypothetical protein
VRLAFLALLLAVCPAGVDVRPAAPGRIDFAVQAVPLAEALECLSQRTGIKVVYDGLSAPRQLVSASMKGATIAEAVERLLEAQGLNYALGLDQSGKRAGLLVVSSRSSAASGSALSGPAARSAASRMPELAMEYPSEGEVTPEPPTADELPAEPVPAQTGPGRPAFPGMMGVPGAPPPLGWRDPRFRPLYPEPVGLTPTTQP